VTRTKLVFARRKPEALLGEVAVRPRPELMSCIASDAGIVSISFYGARFPGHTRFLLPGFRRPRRWGEREMPVDDRIALLTFAVLVDHAVYVRHSLIGAVHVPGRG